MLTVLPDTVQTPVVVEANVTALPDAPPVAETAKVPEDTKATGPGFAPKLIVCVAWLLVSAKLAVVAAPDEATTLNPPALPLAVIAVEVATPETLVTAVFTPPAKVTLAPVWAGAVKVTLAPDTALPPLSVTLATSGLVKALKIGVDWLLPDTSDTVAGAPAATETLAVPVIAGVTVSVAVTL